MNSQFPVNPGPTPVELYSDPQSQDAIPVKSKKTVHIILFFLTCATSVIAGYVWYLSYVSQIDPEFTASIANPFEKPSGLLFGISYGISVMVILLAHEFGHYLTCRYYRIRATLPYVIPAPPFLNPFGTFGAVIKIKSLFRDKKQLFDVGIAGPLAGFVFILPATVIGLLLSTEFSLDLTTGGEYFEFGEPLLFQIAVAFFFDGDSASINLHPIGWAAWFGMLATSLNLLPIGQLDGGHIVYALFGKKGHQISSYLTFTGLILLSLYSWPMAGYLVFAVFLLIMRFRHPRPLDEASLNDKNRYLLGVLALFIFVLTFIPVPVTVINIPSL